jgi:hypothetical protein
MMSDQPQTAPIPEVSPAGATEDEAPHPGGPGPGEATSLHPELETYAGGSIQAYHGTIPAWLLAVYAVLFAWALYYPFSYWGGLGPGLDY